MSKARPPIVFGLTFEKFTSLTFWNSYGRVIRQTSDMVAQAQNARTDRARNAIVEHMLRYKKATGVLFLDSDQVFPPNIVERLLRSGKEVVGSLYFHRAWPYQPHMYTWSKTDVDISGRPGLDAVREWKHNELVECDCVGTGGLYIARRIFEEVVKPPWFEYGGQEESEDITFARKLTAAGIKSYCDTGCESGHIAEVIIGHENWEWAKSREKKGEKHE